MNPKCIQAVNAAAGKPLSTAKLKAIEDGISGKMRELARRDRQRWQGLTHDQRMIEAATEAAHDVLGQAALKEARATMQILRSAETEARITGQRGLSDLTRSQGWIRDMEHTQTYIDAVRVEAIGSLGDMLDAVEVKDGAGVLRKVGMAIFDLDNPGMTAAVVREVFKGADGHTGNAVASKAARAWLDTIEGLRVRFNSAGGDIGKLGYGYLSQHHDAIRIGKAGPDAWADRVLPLLDREQYVEVDGTLTPPDKLRAMLIAAHETLATGGDNKTAPGAFKGTGAKANTGSKERVLHFRDGDAWMAYMQDFGEGSLYDAMLGHVGAMSKAIGLVERYGPNPEQQARVQHDTAQRADSAGTFANRSFGTTPESRWSLLNGAASSPVNPTVAAWGEGLRNVQTAAKLGAAVISSLTDIGSIAQTLHFNRLPYFEYLSSLRGQMNKGTRAELRAHGIIGEAYADALNRFTGEHLAHSITGKLASATMKLSMMNMWSDAHRRAFSMTHMAGWARNLGKAWSKLDEWDQHLLQRAGITEDDWRVITTAQASDVRGNKFLTPAAIRAVSDADVQAARSAEMGGIKQRIADQTAELTARNQQDQQWIKGRIDKFDDARDSLNRAVKDRAAKRQGKADAVGDALRDQIDLLDVRREQAQLQADMESDFNKLATRDDVTSFLGEVRAAAREVNSDSAQGVRYARRAGEQFGARRERLQQKIRAAGGALDAAAELRVDDAGNVVMSRSDAAASERAASKLDNASMELERAALERDISAELNKLSSSDARAALREAIADGGAGLRRDVSQAVRDAEASGRRYGERKGKLERQARELENRAGEAQRQAGRDTNVDAKAVQAKADAMAAELKDFIQRSTDRQARRQHVIDRLTREEAPMLAAESQRLRNQIATKWGAFVSDEAQFAVINPDQATRAIVTGGGMPRGTVQGEAIRSFYQFKSFPAAMMSRHWRRLFDTPQGLQGAPAGFGAQTERRATVNRVAMFAAMNVSLMLLGVGVMQTKALLGGKDLMNMDPSEEHGQKFWAKAWAQGGAMSFVADALLADPTDGNTRTWEDKLGLAGPVAGAIGGAFDVGPENLRQWLQGKDTHLGPEALRWINSQLPGASLWQIRQLWQREVIDQAQEAMNPGYLARMKQRAQKDWGTGWWWAPGDRAPDRAPDLTAVGGQ